jgi:hypothetical protein
MLNIKMPEPSKNTLEPIKAPMTSGAPIIETGIPKIGQAPSHEFSNAPYSMARQRMLQ